MNTAEKLAKLYVERALADEQFLDSIKALFPEGAKMYHSHGHGPAPKLAIVQKVELLKGRVKICVQNPKTGNAKWIGLGSVLGREESGYNRANTEDVYARTLPERKLLSANR